jgi:3-deoxy-alpha-D-manno-octulosonate 8-oxidase
MLDNIRIFKQVPRIIFGEGAYDELDKIVAPYQEQGYVVFLIDEVHLDNSIYSRIPNQDHDVVRLVNTNNEPKTDQVNHLRDEILISKKDQKPSLIVGIGGGSTMDMAKAVSILLTNGGIAEDYQGWDLVSKPAIPKLAIPTLSGTGAEASRTAVFTAKDKKYGINSDYSMYDLVMMDPTLLEGVPVDQEFYTGMDCYIHSVESLEGSFINSFGMVYATSAKDLCTKYFMKESTSYKDLMVSSYMGGASVANAEVGVAHALSYGLSLILGFRHGIANCIVFNQLEDFYPKYVPEFIQMMSLNQIELPKNVTKNATPEMLQKMVNMTLNMERPLTSALGKNWRNILTKEKILELYGRM